MYWENLFVPVDVAALVTEWDNSAMLHKHRPVNWRGLVSCLYCGSSAEEKKKQQPAQYLEILSEHLTLLFLCLSLFGRVLHSKTMLVLCRELMSSLLLCVPEMFQFLFAFLCIHWQQPWRIGVHSLVRSKLWACSCPHDPSIDSSVQLSMFEDLTPILVLFGGSLGVS